MKSVLVISNTYYQLITAIRLRETIWKENNVEIVLSDQSQNSKKVAKRLESINIFNKVYWIKTKNLCQNEKNIRYRLGRWYYIIFGLSYSPITDRKYDELVYYNPDAFVYGIFSKLILSNSNMICSRYEEGVLSYADSIYLNNSRLRYTNTIRKILNKPILEEKTKNFYCFYPQWYSGKLNAIPIPQFGDLQKNSRKLRAIFNIDEKMLDIKEKYIFFTSVLDFEGEKPIGEFELVMKVADIVGKDNLIVKTHPRDNRTVYNENGLNVYKNSSVPWEAIQLNSDFSNKYFLTVNSGSVLGANLMLENKTKSLFLYKCCDFTGNTNAVLTVKDIENLIEMHFFEHEIIRSIDSLVELENIVSLEDTI